MKLPGALWIAATALTVTTAVSYAKPGSGVSAEIRGERPSATAVSSPRAIVDRYCLNCHNEMDFAGELAFDTLDVENVGKDADVWEKAVRKLRVRAMPPHGDDIIRPDEREYTALLSYLETSLDAHAAKHPDPGRPETFHRLNRTEYQNAVRDVLALEIDAASMLPGDDASHGFDNVNVGELSPTLLDQYISTARKVSRLAVGTPLRTPAATSVVLPLDLTQNDQIDEALPLGTRGGTSFRHVFPQDGDYQFQIRLTRDRDDRLEGLAEPHQIELMVDGARLQLFDLPALTTAQTQSAAYADKEGDADARLSGRFTVTAGPHRVAVAFLKKPSVLSEAARQPFYADYNGRNQAAVFSVSVAGPYNVRGAGDTPSRRRIFGCTPATPAEEDGCARTIVSALARRAYRRPVTSSEVGELLTFYEEGRADGGTFDNGVEMSLRALLVSPQFLFRIERDPAGIPANTPYRLNDLELASRLSFFLWSSIPDDPLIDAAIRGTLKQPRVLERHVRRMLADPRSDALVTSFAAQWLHLRNLTAATPDPRLFPDFDDNLRRAFRRETELFFDSVKREDRNVLDLLRADYTFVNERLAKHYGIPNVYGGHFRRVTLPKDSPRRGLLGQASILTVTSYGDRTSPVRRGKWILENLLGLTPPPPPPDVPALKERVAGGKVLTMRQRMAQHRENPACSGCHNLMDPIGLATENFDAVGRFRAVEDGMPVDASGGLPDGATFTGIEGLRAGLLRKPELFVGTMTEKLITYAIGRGLEPADAPAVRAIERGSRGADYRFSSLILGVVNSAPFQMRRSQ
jgi:mono/diheme cytochrome c family protein